MESAPWLAPVPPHAGAPVQVTTSPFWIGAATDADLALFLPGIAARHVAIMLRADGYWIAPQREARSTIRRNGEPLVDAARLATAGDVIELLPGVAYQVAVPAARDADLAPVDRPPAAVDLPARSRDAAAARPPWYARPWSAAGRRRWSGRERRRSWRVALLGLLMVVAVALTVGAGVAIVRALRLRSVDAPPPLSDADAAAYDVLSDAVADHVERGATLLDLGATDQALHEFGAAITLLESSRLRDNVWVRPRIAALEQGISAVYRERRVPTPARYAGAAGAIGTSVLARVPRLERGEFAARLERVQSDFAARFGRPLVVTGRDHAEHLALYGAGSAVDLRVRDLTSPQIAFVIERLRGAGMRVKDFSTDAVLRAQIEAARRNGLADRAGTGLHLHVDRFVDRRDRWTVQ